MLSLYIENVFQHTKPQKRSHMSHIAVLSDVKSVGIKEKIEIEMNQTNFSRQRKGSANAKLFLQHFKLNLYIFYVLLYDITTTSKVDYIIVLIICTQRVCAVCLAYRVNNVHTKREKRVRFVMTPAIPINCWDSSLAHDVKKKKQQKTPRLRQSVDCAKAVFFFLLVKKHSRKGQSSVG